MMLSQQFLAALYKCQMSGAIQMNGSITVLTSFFILLSLCMAHHRFYSAFSVSCAPVAARDAFGRGSSQYISGYHVQLILTTCCVRYCIALCDNCSIGQL